MENVYLMKKENSTTRSILFTSHNARKVAEREQIIEMSLNLSHSIFKSFTGQTKVRKCTKKLCQQLVKAALHKAWRANGDKSTK